MRLWKSWILSSEEIQRKVKACIGGSITIQINIETKHEILGAEC